jgi:hypothetical protein
MRQSESSVIASKDPGGRRCFLSGDRCGDKSSEASS